MRWAITSRGRRCVAIVVLLRLGFSLSFFLFVAACHEVEGSILLQVLEEAAGRPHHVHLLHAGGRVVVFGEFCALAVQGDVEFSELA